MEEITIAATIDANVDKVWEHWTNPESVKQWNAASDDWHTTQATNDLRVGGTFSFRMEAKDGSFGFDFGGEYIDVQQNEVIEFKMGDARKVRVTFTGNGSETIVTETFDAEETNPIEFQRNGWQAILNNFKTFVEQQ